MEECGHAIFDTEELKTLLQHHQHHGNLKKSKSPSSQTKLLPIELDNAGVSDNDFSCNGKRKENAAEKYSKSNVCHLS